MTSSLFLFYVDSVLVLPQYSGLLLLTFFISGAIAAPIWAARSLSDLEAQMKETLSGEMLLQAFSRSPLTKRIGNNVQNTRDYFSPHKSFR